MRQILLLMIYAALTGCATGVAGTADSDAGATAVNRYGALDKGPAGNACPGGTRKVCVSRAGGDACSCINTADFRDQMRRNSDPRQFPGR